MNFKHKIGAALSAAGGWLPDALMVSGAAAVSGGVGMVHPASGVIVAGVFALLAGWLLSRGAK